MKECAEEAVNCPICKELFGKWVDCGYKLTKGDEVCADKEDYEMEQCAAEECPEQSEEYYMCVKEECKGDEDEMEMEGEEDEMEMEGEEDEKEMEGKEDEKEMEAYVPPEGCVCTDKPKY